METKITKVETYIVKDKLSQSFYFSQWKYSERCICLVKITDTNGQYGWGEGYGPASVLEAGIKLLKPLLIGENPLQNEVIWNKMHRKTLDYARKGVLIASISAIDIAVMDLKGKNLGLSVANLLGGHLRKKVQPYATGMYFSDLKNPSKNYQKEAEKYINMGFKAIKMKVGLGVKQDFQNVKLMREIIGDDIMLMIDSNHAYSYNEALSLSKKIEQLVSENQKMNKELKLLKNKSHLNYDNNSTRETLNGIVFEYKIYDDLVIKELKPNAENFIKNNNSNIVCLISKIDNKASIVVAVDKTFTSKFSAVEMVNEVSAILGGKGGGGRPDMAQSGGSDPKNSLQAINKIKDYIKLKI